LNNVADVSSVVNVQGILLDGTPFDFDITNNLDLFNSANIFLFDEGIAVIEQAAPPVFLGDVNQDGVVNFSDIPAFIAILQSR